MAILLKVMGVVEVLVGGGVLDVEVDAGGGVEEVGGGVEVLELPEPAFRSSVSSCDLVMQVSAPESSLTQSSLVLTRLAKKSPIPLVASANQLLNLLKNPSAKLSDAGVEEAVVEAIVVRLRSSSFTALVNTAVMLVKLMV